MKTKLSALIARLLLACLFACPPTLHAAAIFTPNNSRPDGSARSTCRASTSRTGSRPSSRRDYIKGEWSGNLLAFPVDCEGTVLFAAERWSGGVAVRARRAELRYGPVHRDDEIGRHEDPVPLGCRSAPRSSSTLEPGTRRQGRTSSTTSAATAATRTRCGAQYRSRKHVLGDIIHSRPLFVDDADRSRASTSAPTTACCTRSTPKRRRGGLRVHPVVLHLAVAPTNFSQIKALDGQSVCPQLLRRRVAQRRQRSRSPERPKTRSSSAASAPAARASTRSTSRIRRRPTEATAASKILWEITPTTINNAASTSYADLGYTYGVPLIVTLNDGTPGRDRRQRLQQPGAQPGGALRHQPHDRREDRRHRDPARRRYRDANPNGLSSPTAIDADRDGKVDYVYAGDINGNLWKFDLRDHRRRRTSTLLYTTSPRAADHRPAGGFAASAGRLHGQLRHRADVHAARTRPMPRPSTTRTASGTTAPHDQLRHQHRQPDADRQDLDRDGRFQLQRARQLVQCRRLHRGRPRSRGGSSRCRPASVSSATAVSSPTGASSSPRRTRRSRIPPAGGVDAAAGRQLAERSRVHDRRRGQLAGVRPRREPCARRRRSRARLRGHRSPRPGRPGFPSRATSCPA